MQHAGGVCSMGSLDRHHASRTLIGTFNVGKHFYGIILGLQKYGYPKKTSGVQRDLMSQASADPSDSD